MKLIPAIEMKSKLGPVIAGGLILAMIGAAAATASIFPLSSDVPDGDVLQVLPKIQRDARGEQVKLIEFIEDGLEPGSSGFHLVWPTHLPSEAVLQLNRTGAASKSLAGDSFVQVDLSNPAAFQQWADIIPEGATGGGFPLPADYPHILVSLDRSVVTQIARGGRYQVGGSWEVRITFDARALGVLGALSGEPNTPSDYFDWFGVPRASGESATVVRLALVVDGVALDPFEVDPLLSLATPVSVTVASGLTEAESAAILSACGF
ncbi:hypothetical protein [Planctomycetes bacterium Pla163]|uniref:hypothetical protein n=1 Tax=Rohdeia mirabilis TaxID=2528008 RepID=UPI0011A4A9C2